MALEDELGVDLFERRSTGVRLTQAGRAFMIDAGRILSDIDRARETASSVAFGTAGRLRLAVCEDATTPTFAAIISAYRERGPNVSLELVEMPSATQVKALRRNEIGAGLLLPPVNGEGVQIEELWRDAWLVAMPKGHRLALADEVAISDLAQEKFITAHAEFGPGCRQQTQDMFFAAGIQPPIVAQALHQGAITCTKQGVMRCMTVRILLSFALSLGLTLGPASVLAQALLPARELSVAAATEAALAALADCRAKGYIVAVAVTDRGGSVRAMVRGDGAGPHHLESARRKAYTAASSGSSTLVWTENLARGLRAPDPNLVHLDGVLIIGGGLPIKAGGEIVGAIGVGGAPGGNFDDSCAQAGISAIQGQLR